MAVVERKRKRGSTFYAVFTWHGKDVWEKAGSNRREAEQIDRLRRKQVKAGTYEPTGEGGATTVRQWAESWISKRTVRSVKDEERWLRLHIMPRSWFVDMPIADVRPRHIDRLIRELQAARKEDGSRTLKDKSISNIIGVLSPMFRAAKRAEICLENPVELERGALKRDSDVDRETYTAAEALVLTRHHAISWPIRVLNALCFFAGLREGEACGRRFRDFDDQPKPLWSMHVRDQYDSKPLKTGRPRAVPVHPELRAILEAWGREGFELLTGRKPTPDDFVVPNISKRANVAHHTKSSFYKSFRKACLAVGIRHRSVHSTRHTFITLTRRGGAKKDVLERITHNAKGDIVDRYTHWEWEPLCEAVLALQLDAHQELHSPSETTGNPGGGSRWLEARSSEISRDIAFSSGVQFPAPPLLLEPKTRGTRNPRQTERQESEGHPWDSAASSFGTVTGRASVARLALGYAALRLGLLGEVAA
jgi:integrase